MNPQTRQILWHQGLFLQPQHLQQLDLGVQERLAAVQQLLPYNWGIEHLQLNDNALLERVIDIQQCILVFPDGTRVRCPDTGQLAARSFRALPLDENEGTPVTVYLGLKRWKAGTANVTTSATSSDVQQMESRYICSIDPVETADLHLSGPSAQIRYLDHLVKIFWEEEIADNGDYMFLPALQIRLDGSEVRVVQAFIPPAVAIKSSEELLHLLKDIREQLLSRIRIFESYKLSGGIQSPDFEAHFLPHLLVLTTLNRFLPELVHLLETPQIHPWHAYGYLRRLVGALSSFSERINVLGQLKDGRTLLPGYDHLNLSDCFHAAHQLIEELLNEILIGGGNYLTLTRKENALFSVSIPAEDFDPGNFFTLVVSSHAQPQDMVASFQTAAKIGGPEDIPNLVARALPGVPYRHRLAPPPGMPRKGDSSYFKLDHNNRQWLGIRNSRTLCVYWDEAPEDAVIELVISRG
jgi:type VI secretion system protein ImpJ